MSATLSVLNLFNIGIGPSSSHTVGPMRAARCFAESLTSQTQSPARVVVTLYGSLALTGIGHGTDKAVLLGLEGYRPDEVPIDDVPAIVERIVSTKSLNLLGKSPLKIDVASDLVFNQTDLLPRHSNGMLFQAFDTAGAEVLTRVYYSTGGGFIIDDSEQPGSADSRDVVQPYPFQTGDEMLAMGLKSGLSVSEMTLQNENVLRPESQTRAALLKVWQVMQDCVERGCRDNATLPGSLHLRRRAPRLYRQLTSASGDVGADPLTVMDWVSLWAMAVNEENAAGHRVVTAPTNGAAGIVPAVLHYYVRLHGNSTDDSIVRFLLTAGAIGILYKRNASISGAEVGCQGEVGVACSMAAAALAEVLNGSVRQVEEAAEIGMEHNLGLTCDPIGGLVQVPCIERNAMGAVKAINAARLALHGDGMHRVSLDEVIATMKQTGQDMNGKYKETSRGGLAVNVPEC